MTTDNIIDIVLLSLLVINALGTVISANLLRSVIALAITSAILAILMFRMGSPLAAVFELSVCTGLISVILFSAVTLTERLTSDRMMQREKVIFLRRFWVLPIIIVIAAILLIRLNIPVEIIPAATTAAPADPRAILWNSRHLDLVGQVAIVLAGAISVVLLFKRRKNE